MDNLYNPLDILTFDVVVSGLSENRLVTTFITHFKLLSL